MFCRFFAKHKQTLPLHKLKVHFPKCNFYHRNPYENLKRFTNHRAIMVHEVFMRTSFCVLKYKNALKQHQISIKSKYFSNASVTAVLSYNERENSRGESKCCAWVTACVESFTSFFLPGMNHLNTTKTGGWKKGSLININVWNFHVALLVS